MRTKQVANFITYLSATVFVAVIGTRALPGVVEDTTDEWTGVYWALMTFWLIGALFRKAMIQLIPIVKKDETESKER